jgi:hypothetical protein
LKWSEIIEILDKNHEKLEILDKMEESGGEPDVVIFDKNSKEICFVDCSTESPKRKTKFLL